VAVHSFAAHPSEKVGVTLDMRKESSLARFKSRWELEGAAEARPVTAGSYVYTPASAYPPDTKGTLSKNGVPVVLQVTEPLLRNLFAVIGQLEADLAGRWVCSASHASAHRPE